MAAGHWPLGQCSNRIYSNYYKQQCQDLERQEMKRQYAHRRPPQQIKPFSNRGAAKRITNNHHETNARKGSQQK